MAGLRRAARGIAGRLMVKRPAGKLGLEALAAKLAESGRTLERRYGAATDSDANRERLRHIVGIERWGQRRLEVLIGKEPVADEYDGYRPSANASWRDLKLAFANTRRATVALARDLAAQGVADERKVPHNTLGDLTAREWLYYLRLHADGESRRIK